MSDRKNKSDDYTRQYSPEEINAFRLDSEASFALLEIQALQYPTRITYKATDTLELRPYPNPLKMGGWWGLHGGLTLAELKEFIRGWRETLRPWEAIGLKKISIRRIAPIYLAEPQSISPGLLRELGHEPPKVQQMAFSFLDR